MTMDMPVSLLDRLFAAGLLIDTGVDGLYGRSGKFEEVITRFEALIDRFGGADNPEAIRFPPGMNRAHFEGSGYMKSFPQLAGTVHSFCGCELDHVSLLQCLEEGKDWTGQQQATDIVLTLRPATRSTRPLPSGCPEGRRWAVRSAVLLLPP